MRKFLDSDFKVILDKYADDEQVAKTGKKLINKYFDGCEAPEPLRNSVTEQTVALSFVITQLSAYHQSKPDKLKPEQMLRIIFAAISQRSVNEAVRKLFTVLTTGFSLQPTPSPRSK